MRRSIARTLAIIIAGTVLISAVATGTTGAATAPAPATPRLERPLSLDAARRAAHAAARGSLARAQRNARNAVQALTIDLEVLAQWTAQGAPHPIAYYTGLLARAARYDQYIDVTARAMSDGASVLTSLRASMPPMAIMISLSEQALRAYEHGTMVRFTHVTTGRPELPTVTGHFRIYQQVSPVEFHSPWPPGSPYYYPPSRATYWMPFYGGYGLHDAPWRARFGPGTNVSGDGPGSSAPTGSHGCVNVPPATAQWLWNWVAIGTPVVVYAGPGAPQNK